MRASLLVVSRVENNLRYAVATQLRRHSPRMNWGMIQMEGDILVDAIFSSIWKIRR